jgi:hypothetical protein
MSTQAVRVRIIAIAGVFLAGAALGAPVKPRPNISVTTVVGDLDSSGLSVDMGSDGAAAYHDGVDGVTSWLTSNGYNGIAYGDWQFSSLASATRTVKLAFDINDAVVQGDPPYRIPANPPYWGTQAFPAKIEVKCTLVYNNMLTMAAGSQFRCPLVNRFETATYGDLGLQPGYSFTGWPETTDVQVRCNTADSGGCNDWFIDPINLGEAVGRLMQTITVGHQTQKIDEGDFYMRFHIHVTRP